MDKIETIEEFYKEKNWIPDKLGNEIGHFNVFRLEPFIGDTSKPIPFKRRDFYKITLIIGENQVLYADKVIDVKKQALMFSNPMVPYQCAHKNNEGKGFFCVFNRSFFNGFGDLNQFEVFKPDGTPVMELTDEQVNDVTDLFQRMFKEINSDYTHKYDLLRTIVFELLHYAMKLKPLINSNKTGLNADKRISIMFMELLERQFPLDESHRRINLRSASDFAERLNVHVNHLNRAVKVTTEKTTTQIISERILLEAKVLLKHSTWNVSEIAYALGFNEATHFDNFFKKNVQMSPMKYKNV